jgi:hypothetical protein
VADFHRSLPFQGFGCPHCCFQGELVPCEAAWGPCAVGWDPYVVEWDPGAAELKELGPCAAGWGPCAAGLDPYAAGWGPCAAGLKELGPCEEEREFCPYLVEVKESCPYLVELVTLSPAVEAPPVVLRPGRSLGGTGTPRVHKKPRWSIRCCLTP